MIKIILSLLVTNSFASDFIVAGAGPYQPTGWRVLQKTHVENVYMPQAGSHEVVQALKGQGFQCLLKPGAITQCRKRILDNVVDPRVAEFIETDLAALQLQVGAPTAAPELVADGDDVKEWRLKQDISIRGKEFSEARYLIGQGLERIFLGEPAEETLRPVSETEINYSILRSVQISQMQFDIYLIEGQLKKQ